VTVSQPGTSCTFTVDPSGLSVRREGGRVRINVKNSTDCAWTASETASWVTIASGSNGRGDGIVEFQVSARTTASSRSTTLRVAGHSIVLTQTGVSTPLAAPTGLRVVR
ncbi:MAG TPA: BACON domain-containing carbohydrate-binding protein, partial [Vicinamibacterales bacterium]|nr:BACON domain-containing carbohydrate-binding protein [Vicinamibacterales bacterium]